MKRLFFAAGIAITFGLVSCAQHDPKSPDTSGSQPYDQPGVGVDTTRTAGPGGTGVPNSNNDGEINNQEINTGDSSNKR